MTQRGMIEVDCECGSCGTRYTRYRTPTIRFYHYARCSGCAFAAWVIERSHKTVERVLH